MPKADATELAPKKIGYNLRHGAPVPEGYSSSPSTSRTGMPAPRAVSYKTNFFGEATERRPWATKREDPPGRLLAGRSFLLLPIACYRDTCRSLHTPVSYPTFYELEPLQHAIRPLNLINPRENIARMSGETIAAHYTNDLEMIEYQDAVTGNRVVAIVLVDLRGSVKPIATLVGENDPFASLVPLDDVRFNATRWSQSQLTDDQFLRQMGIDPIGRGMDASIEYRVNERDGATG